ncbi:MAG: tetratricopeptide repeat protein, partial [Gallionellaceae bacterium]
MRASRLLFAVLLALLVSCSTGSNRGSIGQLKNTKVDLTDATIEGGFEKAMQSYQKFLEQTPESSMTPEAMRRLADLKIQQEYGTLEGASKSEKKAALDSSKKIDKPAAFDTPQIALVPAAEIPIIAEPVNMAKAGKGAGSKKKKAKEKAKESADEFEKRATKTEAVKSKIAVEAVKTPDGAGADLQSAGALEAIALYKKLLLKYPNYERNDQVLYQMSRAYEEIGQVEEAMKIMNRIVAEYPKSRYIDEVQFRRGEYFFTRKKFLDSEDAFKSIVDMGQSSSYFELALYKLGWSFYKQQLYEDALHRFVALLDYKVTTGYDFEHPKDNYDGKRIEDTYRVISLAFSNLGGSDAI